MNKMDPVRGKTGPKVLHMADSFGSYLRQFSKSRPTPASLVLCELLVLMEYILETMPCQNLNAAELFLHRLVKFVVITDPFKSYKVNSDICLARYSYLSVVYRGGHVVAHGNRYEPMKFGIDFQF